MRWLLAGALLVVPACGGQSKCDDIAAEIDDYLPRADGTTVPLEQDPEMARLVDELRRNDCTFD